MSVSTALPLDARWKPPVWLIISCGCAIALLAFGPRSAMGFFQQPMLDDRGWDSATFGLAIAIQNLAWGVGQPIFGAIADRFGAYKSLAAGGIIYAFGLYIMGTAETPLWLYVGGGVLVGLGVAAGSFGIILSVFARNVPADKRSLVFGMGTAAGSAGMFLFSPLSAGLIANFGWSHGLVILSLLLPPVILSFPFWPRITSLPLLPFRTSEPSPPSMMSFP